MRPEDICDLELPRLDGYRVISAIGAGSHGVVFLARDLATQEMVAVKVYHGGAAPEGISESIRAFANRKSGLLVRPRASVIAPSGAAAVVADHANGEPLSRALARGVRFTPRKSARVAEQAARALAEAEALVGPHGTLHPGKIMVEADFARLLGAGEKLAVPLGPALAAAHLYASPEALQGGPPSVASDVYALGACLYHMLTGYPPSKAGSLEDLRAERRRGCLAWPKGSSQVLPLDLVALVDRMTSPDPAARPAGGETLAAAISAAARGVSVRRPSVKAGVKTPAHALPAVEPDAPAPPTASSVFDRLGISGTNALIAASAAAVLAVALVAAMRPSAVETRQPSGQTPPVVRKPSSVPTAPPPAPEAPAIPERKAESPRMAEFRVIEAELSGNAAEYAELKRRLLELTNEDGDAGAEARRLLERIEELREERARELLERMLDKASVHRASGRLGEALQALGGFPPDLADTAAAERLRTEEAALRAMAGEAFRKALAESRVLAAAGRHAEARAVLARIEQAMGLEPWVTRAREEITAIDLAEAATHAERARARAEAESRALRDEALALLARLPEMCRTYQYAGAETAMKAAMLRPLEADLGGRVAEYAEMVRRESAQFRLAGERIRAGKGEGKIVVPGTELELKIADIHERGLELVGGGGQGSMNTLLPWTRLPEREAYKLMLHLGGDESIFTERLAIAIFAHHRGLRAETAAELTAAQSLARRREEHDALRRVTSFIYRVPEGLKDAVRR